MSQQGIMKIEKGSYLKQLMTNLDNNPFGILNNKSFLHSEAFGAGLVLEPIQVGNGSVKVSGKFLNDWYSTMAGKLDI